MPKKNTKQIAKKTLRCQHRTITRDIKQVVTSITEITAKPVPQETIRLKNYHRDCIPKGTT